MCILYSISFDIGVYNISIVYYVSLHLSTGMNIPTGHTRAEIFLKLIQWNDMSDCKLVLIYGIVY